ncbi:MAG: sigma-70 family RNA polymerase sigma factor, partial [Ilumatobacteraceae bacterium]
MLWRRHSPAAHTAARSYARLADPADMVSEAFAEILKTLKAGSGPTDAFRPYLYTVIRNQATKLMRQAPVDPDENMDAVVDESTNDDAIARDLDARLALDAYKALPENWQALVWYTEVEQLRPREIAKLMGTSANSISAMAYRARKALRVAWIQAHITHVPPEPECAQTRAQLGDYVNGSLPPVARRAVTAHLETCPRCTNVLGELSEVA